MAEPQSKPSPPPPKEASRADQAGALLLGRVLAALSESIVLLVVVRLLGKAEVGALTAILLVYQTLALIMTAGVPATLSYFMPTRETAERAAIARATFRALAGLGVLMGAILAGIALWDMAGLSFFGDNDSQGSLRYLLALCLWPLFDLPVRALPNFLVVEGRAREAAFAGIVKTVGSSAVTVIPVALGASLWTLGASMTAFGALYALSVPYLMRVVYPDVPRVVSPVSPRRLLSFAVPLGMTDIMGVISQRIDRYIILGLLTAEAFAEYQVGAWQIPFIVNIPYAVGAAWAPHLRRLFAEGKPLEAIAAWRQAIHRVSVIVVPVSAVFIVAAEETMTLLFTEDYVRAADVFRCYSLLTAGRVAAFGSVIVAAGRPRFVLFAAVLSLLCTLAAEIPLAYAVGFLGPAIGAVVAYVPMVTFYCWFIARAAGLSLSQIFPLLMYLRIAALASVAGGVGYLLKTQFALPPWGGLLVVALSTLSVFAVLATLTRDLGREDWAYVGRWLKLQPLARQ